MFANLQGLILASYVCRWWRSEEEGKSLSKDHFGHDSLIYCNFQAIVYNHRKMLCVTARRAPLQRLTVVSLRTFSAQASSGATGQPIVNTNVAGLSDNCVKVPNTSVGPGAAKDKEYKNPEYFCYHADTIAESEVELAKYRLPVPSNKRPFHR